MKLYFMYKLVFGAKFMQRIETISHQDVQKFLKHYLDISIKYLKDNGNELTKQQIHKYKEIVAAIKGLPS
jgi:hypothetical protein